MRITGRLILAGIISLTIIAVGTIPAGAADTLVLGFSMAKTGPFVSFTTTNELAANMAMEEINAMGGINGKKIKIVGFDTSGDPKQAAVAVRKFAKDDNALAVIGPFSSGEAGVAFKVGETLGIVQMPMASSKPGLAKPYKFGFRNTTNEVITVIAVMKSLKKHGYPIKNAAIAHGTDDAISKAMGTQVFPLVLGKKFGIDIVNVVTFKVKGTFDLSAQVSQLMTKPTDLVAVGAPPEQAIILVKEMRRQGHKGRIIAGSTISDPELPERMGKAGEGTVVPTLFYGDLNDRTKKFTADFAKRTKAAGLSRTIANQFDASTYDIVLIYAEAMKRANVTGDVSKLKEERIAIRDELFKMKDFPALEGLISFGADGDALKTVYVLEIKDGHLKLLDAHPGSSLVGP
jgi:branched-chain amino acid transport system substrate-binding protein